MLRPLLMIPGPVEVSPAVRERFAEPPPSHLAPALIEAFGAALGLMRQVWLAPEESQPFVVPGSGTLAMEMAVANLTEPGDRALVVNTGFFSDRLAEMLRRHGAMVREVRAAVGDVPHPGEVEAAWDRAAAEGPIKALWATHVDTSTGVRLDPEPLARLARSRDALSVIDGVCAAAGERFEMKAWGVDLYLTASQKALGLPPGLGLFVAGPRALSVRENRRASAPPLVLDWAQWQPVMRAYEERRPAYFATPATNLILALETGLREITAGGLAERIHRHAQVAAALRGAWRGMGLELVPRAEALAASTLSAVRYPQGVGSRLIASVLARGVTIAGGLHPEIRDTYFRVGHMGWAVTQPELLVRTVTAIAEGLRDCGARVDSEAAARVAF
jgi:alanine-glyoxylate transaminase / serine-glyoxylate transaminase / serine-pyruvate transaminase